MDSNTNVKFGNKNVKKKIMGLIYTDHWGTYFILLVTIEDITIHEICFLPSRKLQFTVEGTIWTIQCNIWKDHIILWTQCTSEN